MCALRSARTRIICGNSLESLPKLLPAKLVFADPPDNIGYSTKVLTTIGEVKKHTNIGLKELSSVEPITAAYFG